jgi:hypothetical protein
MRIMRSVLRLTTAVALSLAASFPTVAAGLVAHSSASVTLRVVHCRTRFGVPPGVLALPRDISIASVPVSASRLVAYSNTSDYLIGPPYLRCAGLVAADGGSTVVLWPHGQREPRQHSSGSGLTLSLIPACVGCKAAVTCPYFSIYRRYAHQIGLSCPDQPPIGEIVRYVTRRLVSFVDPPFVAGAGWPSGLGLRATGLVGIEPGRDGAVFTATCTLPAAQRVVCVDSLDAERSLYG